MNELQKQGRLEPESTSERCSMLIDIRHNHKHPSYALQHACVTILLHCIMVALTQHDYSHVGSFTLL